MLKVESKEEECPRSQIVIVKGEAKSKKEMVLELIKNLSRPLTKPFLVESGQAQVSVLPTPVFKINPEMSELMTCKSSQSLLAPMPKLLSVFTKNILYPTQSGPKVPFREAEIQVKQFAKDVITAA